MRADLRRARLPALVALVPLAGLASGPGAPPPPREAYVVIVAAPDLAESADLAHVAADDIAGAIVDAISPARRTSLAIRAAASNADTTRLCRRMTACEVVRVRQQPAPRNPDHSELSLITETARGNFHHPAQMVRHCGIRPALRAAYARCRERLAADIAQEIRAHDQSLAHQRAKERP